VGFKSIRVAIFYAGLPKPNATLLLYLGLGPAMLRRLRREESIKKSKKIFRFNHKTMVLLAIRL